MTAPRPEFGRPETGLVRHWFRTDAQMRRHYMTPEQREVERKRIGERRAMAKHYRAEIEEFKRRAAHRHFTCRECLPGMADVGAFDGKDAAHPTPEVGERVCCTCLSVSTPRVTYPSVRGPNFARVFRCRVLDPEPEPEAETEDAWVAAG